MIASPLYEQIIASMPIPGVEAMIVKDETVQHLKGFGFFQSLSLCD